jgi:hypothetical protein
MGERQTRDQASDATFPVNVRTPACCELLNMLVKSVLVNDVAD